MKAKARQPYPTVLRLQIRKQRAHLLREELLPSTGGRSRVLVGVLVTAKLAAGDRAGGTHLRALVAQEQIGGHHLVVPLAHQ